jgi:restriction endonuclease Mrr
MNKEKSMTVRELRELLFSIENQELEVSVYIDTGRSYSFGSNVTVSEEETQVLICGEEPDGFCP